jgi:hypothetical protein
VGDVPVVVYVLSAFGGVSVSLIYLHGVKVGADKIVVGDASTREGEAVGCDVPKRINPAIGTSPTTPTLGGAA